MAYQSATKAYHSSLTAANQIVYELLAELAKIMPGRIGCSFANPNKVITDEFIRPSHHVI